MRCGIALGSNLGDRLAHLRQARASVQALGVPGAPVLISSVYETEPVDCEPGAAPYLNATMEIEFEGQPMLLLDSLQQIESAHGRPSKRPRNAPRTIDLDVLYAGNLVLSNDEIIIPHPRLHSRRFVLQPLHEIRPSLLLPGYHETIEQLLANLPPNPAVKRFSETWD